MYENIWFAIKGQSFWANRSGVRNGEGEVGDECCMRRSFIRAICLCNRRQLWLSGRVRLFTAIGRLLQTPSLSPAGRLSGNPPNASPYLWQKETDCTKLQNSVCLPNANLHAFLHYLNTCVSQSHRIIFSKYSVTFWGKCFPQQNTMKFNRLINCGLRRHSPGE